MTLERVLRAGLQSMIGGHHAPHCYHAWVQGRGYVNDGSRVFDRADYLRQLTAAAQSEIDNMGYATAYAEPGYTQPMKGILLANWNHFPSTLPTVLEHLGYACEWSDEWITCEGCNHCLRTSPDSYSWTSAYQIVEDSAILCQTCYTDEYGNENASTL